MSRENRVNPGMYTQAGRLSPDDAAREIAKQRQPLNGGHGKGNPKSRSEGWMNQAAEAREASNAPAAAATEAWSAAFMLFSAAAVCLSLYAAKRLASAARSRRSASSVPATNHTPGRPYAYGV
jgi:hypothetical protein